MLPLYHDPHFTFRFADDRLIPRFHLEGVEAELWAKTAGWTSRSRSWCGLASSSLRCQNRRVIEHDLDGVVQLAGKAVVDASPVHD